MENTYSKIQELLHQKADCQARLNLLPYDGTPEIKDRDGLKYLYIRKRVGSRLTSTYVDVYSEELYQLLLRNSREARELRKQIRHIEKDLAGLGYEEANLSPRVMLNLDFARANMKVNIYDQAVLEGVAFGLRDSLEVARSLGIKIERTKICGGGAKSPLWKKIIANVMNLKVDVIESEEGPGYGGAMLAAVGCGEYDSVQEAADQLVKVVDTVEPDDKLVAKYEAKYQQFREIYPALKGVFQKFD